MNLHQARPNIAQEIVAMTKEFIEVRCDQQQLDMLKTKLEATVSMNAFTKTEIALLKEYLTAAREGGRIIRMETCGHEFLKPKGKSPELLALHSEDCGDCALADILYV